MTWQDEYESLKRALLPNLEISIFSLSELSAHPLNNDAAFNELALQLFDFQRRHNNFYRAYVAALGNPVPQRWTEIPPVWTNAFKRARAASCPTTARHHFYRTSGTTEGESGIHEFVSLDLYERAVTTFFRPALLPEGKPLPMAILTPSPEESPHSSLVHMMETVRRTFGSGECRYFLHDGLLDLRGLLDFLRRYSRRKKPVLVAGTAFAFAYLLEGLRSGGVRLCLPEGSRIMETGGFKGRVKEIPRRQFYEGLEHFLGVPQNMIVNEYGMTELSSQFYDTVLTKSTSKDASQRDNLHRVKAGPPWTRVRVVDPLTGKEVNLGERGLIRIYDLANLGSVVAIQTEDVGVRHSDGFEILGRVSSAPLRGCSLDAEILFQGA
jgi:hypothetical protein